MPHQELIKQLKELKDKAEQHSRNIIINGQKVPEVHRAKAAGYADAYSFCIMQLERIEYENS